MVSEFIMNEIWKFVNGYEGIYKVSSYGNVRSLSRQEKSCRYFIIPEKVLKPQIDNGYHRVVFYDGSRHLIHRLVASAFKKKTQGKIFVNHKDGDKSNNHVSNLEWCTRSENEKHAHKTGLKKATRICKLTDNDVISIREYSKSGMMGKDIHLKYFPKVAYQTVSDIIARRRWQHL